MISPPLQMAAAASAPPSSAKSTVASSAPSALAAGVTKGAYSEVVRASIDLKSRADLELKARNDPSVRASTDAMRKLQTGVVTAVGGVAVIPEVSRETVVLREKERVNINATVKAADVVVHKFSNQEMTEFLKTNLARGLTAAEGREKLARDGPNVLTPPPETPWYVKLALQMVGGFQVMMIVGAILCFIVGPLTNPIDYQSIYLGIVLVVVVLSTGFFAWWQERKSDSVMAGFKALTPSRCNVMRDGQVIEMDAKELVVGDICLVNFGEKVRPPASLRSLLPPPAELSSGTSRLPHPRGCQLEGACTVPCPCHLKMTRVYR
jgi:magnesium-transporting ATPase (P-type)